MNHSENEAGFEGVAILDRSQPFGVAVARLLAPGVATIDGGATTSVAELSDRAIQWATKDANNAKMLLVRAELSNGGDGGGPHEMCGIDLARRVQAAVPDLAVHLFGVMQAERVLRCARGCPLPYIDLIAHGATLRPRVRALLDNPLYERSSVTFEPNAMVELASRLSSFERSITPALAQDDDGSAIDGAVTAAFASAEWRDIQSTSATLVIPDHLHPDVAAQIRELRSRLVGLGAMARGLAQESNRSDRRRLAADYLQRIDTARLLVERYARSE